MFERQITESTIKDVIVTGKVIEDYPADTPYPSCLMLGYSAKRPIHVVVAKNPADQSFIVITVYEPDSEIWEPGFERRKKP